MFKYDLSIFSIIDFLFCLYSNNLTYYLSNLIGPFLILFVNILLNFVVVYKLGEVDLIYYLAITQHSFQNHLSTECQLTIGPYIPNKSNLPFIFGCYKLGGNINLIKS